MLFCPSTVINLVHLPRKTSNANHLIRPKRSHDGAIFASKLLSNIFFSLHVCAWLLQVIDELFTRMLLFLPSVSFMSWKQIFLITNADYLVINSINTFHYSDTRRKWNEQSIDDLTETNLRQSKLLTLTSSWQRRTFFFFFQMIYCSLMGYVYLLAMGK